MTTVDSTKSTSPSSRSRRTPARLQTRICCEAPEATAVAVAGSFNDWDPTSASLQREGQGPWAVMLDLPPGRYEYKFMVDGTWCCEPGTEDDAPGEDRVPNDFGTMNRVLIVE